MNILVTTLMPSQVTAGREVFGNVTKIEPLDGPYDARNRVRIWLGDESEEFDLNNFSVELLPENR